MSVQCKIEDSIAFVTIDDGKANAVNEALTTELLTALQTAEQAQAVILQGRAGFFSAGLDLKTLPSLPLEKQRAAFDGFEHVTRKLAAFPRPVIAAVAGHAFGAGACFVLACDVAIGLRGSARIGLNEAAIGVTLPPFLLELGRIKLLAPFHMRAFTHGEAFSFEDGLKAGFFDELVDSPEALLQTAKQRAATLAKLPHESYFETKTILRKSLLDMRYPQIAQYVGPAFNRLAKP